MADQDDAPQRGAIPRFLWPPGIFLAVLGPGVAMHFAHPLQVLPPWPARIAGAGLLVVAGALATWAQRVMHAAGTHVHPWKPTLALVTSGPFGHTRNPMYTALCLVHLGIGLLIDDVWPIAGTAILFVALWLGVVVREERYLVRLMGEPYRAYCRSVPRWGWRF